MSDERPDELEKAMKEGSASDPEIDSLARLGDEVKKTYAADVRPDPGAKALFVSGVAARGRRSHLPGLLVPVAAGMALILIAVGVLGRTSDPGQALYPVRDALDNVGLADKPVEFVNDHIRSAEWRIERADDILGNEQFGRAEDLVLEALVYLTEAERVLDDLSGEQREEAADEIADLQEDAKKVLADISEERMDAASGARMREDDDSSGPGSGDEDRDDSSGPGSGDEDDSSGPGSGDDDSSGPGSGDDSSGSGSSGSGSSGSGSSGSGSDDTVDKSGSDD
jgi:uncharacterized membrane protein YgcG